MGGLDFAESGVDSSLGHASQACEPTAGHEPAQSAGQIDGDSVAAEHDHPQTLTEPALVSGHQQHVQQRGYGADHGDPPAADQLGPCGGVAAMLLGDRHDAAAVAEECEHVVYGQVEVQCR